MREPVGESGAIDWCEPAEVLEALVRSGCVWMAGEGGAAGMAHGVIEGLRIGIVRAAVGGTRSAYPPGTITRCDEQVWVQTGRGHLVIERVYAEGAEHGAAEYFARVGARAGDAFEKSVNWGRRSNGGTSSREISHAA